MSTEPAELVHRKKDKSKKRIKDEPDDGPKKKKKKKKKKTEKTKQDVEHTGETAIAEPYSSKWNSQNAPPSILSTSQSVSSRAKPTTNTGLHLITVSMWVPVAPINYNKPLQGAIADLLSPLLLTYHPPFKGIVLAHQNARVTGPPHDGEKKSSEVLALSINEYAASFMWITMDVLVFRPSKGVWLDGVVTIQNESQIGLMVYNLFNATVERSRLPTGWKWVPESRTEPLHGQEQYAGRGRRDTPTGYYQDEKGKKVQGLMAFRVRDFELGFPTEGERNMISIEGSLLDDKTEKERDKAEREVLRSKG